MEDKKRKIYYQTTTQIQLPENPQWRYWKFELPDGSWKIFKGIKNLRQLRDYLVKYNPVSFYYSTSQFLPQQLPDKIENPNYQVADQLFIQNKRLVIDVDNEDGYEQVRNSCHKIIKRMGKFKDSYLYDKLIFTSRGARIEFKDLTENPWVDPRDRENWLKLTRKQFCLQNLADIKGVDDIISWDTRRVIKCIGSPNKYNDYVTKVISSPAYIPAIPGKNQVNEMSGVGSTSLLRKKGKLADQGLGYSPSLPLYFGKFIRNKIEGTKNRFVPYFVYYKKFKHWKDDLKFLQEQYNLSTMYIIDDYMKVFCLSLDALEEKRLDKIYRRSKTLVKNTWRKFKQIFIRTSSYYEPDLKKIKKYDLKPLFKLDNTPTVFYPLSRPHFDFLNFIGFDLSELDDTGRIFIGNDKNRVSESFFEKKKENDR